jgi:hypothetical protein
MNTLKNGTRVFVPMENTYGTIKNLFTASTGEQGYEVSFSDGDEGSYLAGEIQVINDGDGWNGIGHVVILK